MFEAELLEEPTKFCLQQAKAKYKKNEDLSAHLDMALCGWRKVEFARRYPKYIGGPWISDWIVLPDIIIDDIIYLAHMNKLVTTESFTQLLDWDDCQLYASPLLPIVHSVFPLPVNPAPPAQSNSAATVPNPPVTCPTHAPPSSVTNSSALALTNPASSTTARRCSNCSETKHNSRESYYSLTRPD